MDDFVVNVKQIFNYPLQTTAGPGDAVLLQQSGPQNTTAGPYGSMNILDIIAQARSSGGPITLQLGETISWGKATLAFNGGGFTFAGGPVNVTTLNSTGDIFVNGIALADQDWVQGIFDSIATTYVSSFNGRGGAVQLSSDDILRAGGILQVNPRFAGTVIVPTAWDPRNDTDQAASCAFVQQAICWWLMNSPVVQSFNGRWGAVTLQTEDVNAAYANSAPGVFPTAPSPALGDASGRIATTLFVDETVDDLKDWVQNEIGISVSQAYAPINSPNFSGVPTAPTANTGTATGQLATCAFVANAVEAATAGVASFNTRTGNVVLDATDITTAGGALLASPVFTGTPQSPTPTAGDSSGKIATTAFVAAAVAAAAPPAGVTSFNTRTGAVTLNTADITTAGGAPLTSPNFSGTPTAPTAAPGASTTQLATTAFVAAALAAMSAGVSSWNGRTGVVNLLANDISAVGGALTASPNFTGTPTAPTAPAATNTQQLATCAFVTAAVAGISVGVSSFNSRTGAVTLTSADLTAVGGALLASPALTGTPSAPTAPQTSNDTTIATTAYVRAALAAAPGGVSSFNSRTGAITLQASDVSAVGGALLSSPAFTGAPTAPTPPNTATGQQIATAAWVLGQLATLGGVSSWNGRAGNVTMTATDIINASGAVYRQSDTAPSVTPNTLWFNSVNGQLYVQYTDPVSSAQNWVIANSQVTPAPAAGTRVLISSQIVTSPVASVNFLYTFTNQYDQYYFECYNLLASADAAFYVQYSWDGSTFDTSGSYAYASVYTQSSSSTVGSSNNAAAGALLVSNLGSANIGFAEIRLSMPWTTDRFKYIMSDVTQHQSAGLLRYVSGGGHVGAPAGLQPLKGVKFLLSTGNISHGVFNLYGIVKAGAGAT